jgi:hypothetical protein
MVTPLSGGAVQKKISADSGLSSIRNQNNRITSKRNPLFQPAQ